MSTSTLIRAAWKTFVFDQDDIQAITPNIYDYDITQNSQHELKKLRHDQEINFITYTVSRTTIGELIGARTYKYRVEVNCFREVDRTGSNYKAASDLFETITDNVVTTLGTSWSSTVDFYTLPTEPPRTAQVTIGTKQVWRSTQIYTAQKVSS